MDQRGMSYPDDDDIEPDLARFLYEEHCAILVVENMPTGSEFGIDLMIHRTGDRFKGIKLIPPGLHLVFASPVDRQNIEQCGPRCGFYHNFKIRELVIKRWSEINEEFDYSFVPDVDLLNRYRSNLHDLDRFLAPYSYKSYHTFKRLTNHLSAESTFDILPEGGILRTISSPETEMIKTPGKPDASRRQLSRLKDQQLLSDLNLASVSRLKMTKIFDTHGESKMGVSAEMITQYNLDSTMKLDEIYPGSKGRELLMAELQFTFVSFILCHVYDCFDHWLKLMRLVCSADRAIVQYVGFYSEIIAILKEQLDHVPEDLFHDIVDSNNLLRSLLDNLFQNIQGAECTEKATELAKLRQACSELKGKLEQKFGWIFDLELDEDMPTIVNLPDG